MLGKFVKIGEAWGKHTRQTNTEEKKQLKNTDTSIKTKTNTEESRITLKIQNETNNKITEKTNCASPGRQNKLSISISFIR